jgi:hypothetical protein
MLTCALHKSSPLALWLVGWPQTGHVWQGKQKNADVTPFSREKQYLAA